MFVNLWRRLSFILIGILCIFCTPTPSFGRHDWINPKFIYRCNVKYQYSAILDSGSAASDRSPKERASRDRAFTACTEWLINTGGRYEVKQKSQNKFVEKLILGTSQVIAHLDDNIGSRSSKHWFLLNDSAVSQTWHSRGNLNQPCLSD